MLYLSRPNLLNNLENINSKARILVDVRHNAYGLQANTIYSLKPMAF